MVAAHVFVDDLGAPVLDDADRHHLQRVLRLRDGEEVTASDGRGGLLRCRWAAGSLEPEGEPVWVPRASLVTVAFAPVKGDRPEWAVQKLTEVGVDRIVALRCERSVVRWDDERAAKHLDRWARVAREAAMQSRRVWLPEVDPDLRTPADFAPVDDTAGAPVAPAAAAGAAGAGGAAVMADRDAEPLPEGARTVWVGPEGGWSDAERGLLPRASLTPTVLRTETAAVAAGVLLCTVRDRLDGRRARSNADF